MSILDAKQQEAAAAATENGLMPAGQYKCRIVAVEPWKGGASLVWKLRIDKDEDWAGREIFDWTGLTERGIWKTRQRFEQLGVPLDAGEDAFLGMAVRVSLEVGLNDATGESKNKVVGVERIEGDIVEIAKEKLGATEVDDDIPF